MGAVKLSASGRRRRVAGQPVVGRGALPPHGMIIRAHCFGRRMRRGWEPERGLVGWSAGRRRCRRRRRRPRPTLRRSPVARPGCRSSGAPWQCALGGTPSERNVRLRTGGVRGSAATGSSCSQAGPGASESPPLDSECCQRLWAAVRLRLQWLRVPPPAALPPLRAPHTAAAADGLTAAQASSAPVRIPPCNAHPSRHCLPPPWHNAAMASTAASKAAGALWLLSYFISFSGTCLVLAGLASMQNMCHTGERAIRALHRRRRSRCGRRRRRR